MSTSTDEFEFTEFTEEELNRIDSIADAAFASDTAAPRSAEPALTLEKNEPSLPITDSRSRKSSFSVFDLTEEELRLLDESVAHLESNNSIQLSSGSEPPSTSARSTTSYIEISLESPLPSTLASSPAPTLGRASSPPTVTMSLYTQFRLLRNGLTVSDLVGPAWCELQFDYGLRGGRHLPASQRPAALQSRTGKVIPVQLDVAEKNDVVKQGGSTVHKKLEREIRPTEITVTATTREDKWGLKHLKDEITRTAVRPGSPTSPIVPGHFPNTSSFPGAVTPSSSHLISISDNKTRGVPSIPKWRDSYQSRLQLMLYKRLLDGLLESPLSSPSPSPSPPAPLPPRFQFSAVWEHHSANPLEPFSAQFLEESAELVLGNQLGPTTAQARCLQDLERAWEEIVGALAGGERIGDEGGAVSKTLKLVYRLRERSGGFKKRSAAPSSSSSDRGSSNRSRPPNGTDKAKKSRADSEDDLQHAIRESIRTYKIETGKDVPGPSQSSDRRRKHDSDENVIGTVEFDYDNALLDHHLSDVLDFWHNRRPPRGVALEDTGIANLPTGASG
ncbi:hypothetical protein FRC10_001207 [Ceratobasidium sp. 414]|nr:hypothetical protein FRC10_001207 [Ceratobasidium sp. 414]